MPDVPPGRIEWTDLTVPNAPQIRDFYAAVTGWTPDSFGMGTYDDYCMKPPDGGPAVAGICHSLGENANLPPVWIIYITVADLSQSLRSVEELGGAILTSVRDAGGQGTYCVIRDPAGAVAALYQRK